MQLNQKETMLLKDLKSQEQICVEKYGKYASQVCDEDLKNLFNAIGQTEQTHLSTIEQMMSGTVPQMTAGSKAQYPQPKKSTCTEAARNQDAFMLKDALDTEKHVSSLYDTCIFEFKDENARNMLNHIQKEEQEHGKHLYDYMAVNNMYC